MADTRKTKLFTSAMPGAPVLSGTVGALASLLDAVLVNGFSALTASSIVVAGGIATVTFATAQPQIVDSVALIAGATPSVLNGEQRVLTASTLGYTFATTASDGTATGTITSKVAPAGWTKAFAGVNLAAYKMGSVEGTGFMLRLDDTGTTTARIRGYEAMTDVSNGVGLFPTVAQFADPGLWVVKSNAADTTARPWYVIADQRGFYLFVKNAGAGSEYQNIYFGDIISLKSNDPYACVIRANPVNTAASAAPLGHELGYIDLAFSYGGLYIARAANTLGGAVQAYNTQTLSVGFGALTGQTGAVGLPYPSQVDNGLILSPVAVYNSAGIRGYLPGLSLSPQITNASFSSGDNVVGSGSMTGRTVKVIKSGSPTVGASQGVCFMDIMSDWRA